MINFSDEYLSNNNIIYLELLPSSQLSNDYDDSYQQFKLFFTTLTPKISVGLNNDLLICPIEHQLDCDDFYCTHRNARCNGIFECRSRIDEDFCTIEKSSSKQISSSMIITHTLSIFVFISISSRL